MKYLIFLFFFQVSAEMAFSQKMEMNHMNQPGRNVFLKMMDTMMVQMETVLDSASVESNFMRQMIPHHQGAVAMADYEIKNGKSFETIQLAKSILTEQEEEIHLMQIWLGRFSNIHYKEALPDGYRLSIKKSMEIMMSSMPPDSVLCDIDLAFSRVNDTTSPGGCGNGQSRAQISHRPANRTFCPAYYFFTGSGNRTNDSHNKTLK
ncbi:MAG: DUF305 domain-containing protein [Puia sp.]